MIGDMLKPLLKYTILPMVEKGNPADFIKTLQPYLDAEFIDPETGKRFWPAQIEGKMYLEVNPHNVEHPIKIRLVERNQLVLPLTPEAIKSMVLKIISISLQEPAADDIINQAKG